MVKGLAKDVLGKPSTVTNLILSSKLTVTRAFLHRLERIDQLIRLRATGTPADFAKKVGVSRSTLFNYIAFLKELGGPIEYNEKRGSYEYEYPVLLKMKYEKEPLGNQ